MKSQPIINPLIKELMAEHEVILQALGVLRVVTERIEKRRSVPLSDLRSLERFFKVYADNIHHHAEEDLLFDTMANVAPRKLRRMMEQLITQHVMGRYLVFRIFEAIAEAAKGLRGWRKKFVSNAQAYDTLLSCHICSEDHHVFPIADRLIQRRCTKLKSGSQPTLRLKSSLEKSIHRMASRYGSTSSTANTGHSCGQDRSH